MILSGPEVVVIQDAIIFVDELAEGSGDAPRCLVKVGGLSVLERQLRQLAACGVHNARVISHRFPEVMHKQLASFKQIPETEILDGRYLEEDLFEENQAFLVLEESTLVDFRLITEVAGSGPEAAIALFPMSGVRYGAAEGLKIETAEGSRLFASAAKFTGRGLKAAQAHPAFTSLPLRTLIEVGMKSQSCEIVDTDLIATYNEGVCRERQIFWRPIISNVEARRAGEVLLLETDHGAADWVERFVMPLFEQLLVLRLATLKPGRSLVQLVVLALAILIFVVLASGRPGLGLALAMAMSAGFGSMRRMRGFYLWRHRGLLPEPLIENFSEYLWYFGLAAGLSAIPLGWSAWALALAMVVTSWARDRQIDFTTDHLGSNRWRSEGEGRRFSLLAANRNTVVWSLAPFALTGLWLHGLILAALYCAASLLLWQRYAFRTIRREHWEGPDEG
jgi:hypothetical protein